MSKTLFYYSQLQNQSCKDMYVEVLKSIQAGKKTASLKKKLTFDEISQVLYALDYDYPEFFYVELFGKGCQIVQYSDNTTEIKFRYVFSAREQKKNIQEIKEFIQYIVSHIPPEAKKNEISKALWLHDILCQNLTYNHDAIKKGGNKKVPEAYSIVGGARDKTAVCSGVAKLYQMLCEYENIWCTYVAGETHLSEQELKNNVEGSAGRHAWNLIRAENVYAYIDVTWDLKEKNEFIRHNYFGMSDEECSRTRTPDQRFSSIRLPLARSDNPINYYRYKGCRFKSFQALYPYVLEKVNQKSRLISFQIDPQGFDRVEIAKRTQEWMNAFFREKAFSVSRWSWYHDDTMLVFDYRIEYIKGR